MQEGFWWQPWPRTRQQQRASEECYIHPKVRREIGRLGQEERREGEREKVTRPFWGFFYLLCFVVAAHVWFQRVWNPTCGYPGEGPSSLQRDDATAAWVPMVEPAWVSSSRSILHGVSQGKGPAKNLAPGCSDEVVHATLMSMAEDLNSSRPIAGRMQTNPAAVSRLLGVESDTTTTAKGGSAYNLSSRPYQCRRPRPIPLAKDQREAAVAEIHRLQHVCGAVETAPPHDGDKALLSTALPWERAPLRTGPWPRERKVPMCQSRREFRDYDRRQVDEHLQRQLLGKPHRDFESTVFTVPKKDGGHRLCTDYRQLNMFQRKLPFKMEGVQQVADLIQPDDFGMLVDLKDAYLTMGLHPSQRKYCRFRSPESGQRLQWTTVSFGMSEAPRACTKLLRPLIGLLKQIGIRCLIYIDDLLLLDQDRDRLARGMAIAMDLLQGQVGLQLKTSKCCFRPLRTFQCLGLVWNTHTMQVSVPAKRLKDTQKTAKRLLRAAGATCTQRSQHSPLRHMQNVGATREPGSGSKRGSFLPIPTRDLARLCGQVTSMTRGIRSARRHLLFLQQALGHAVRRTGWTGSTTLNLEGINAMRWWVTEEPWLCNGDQIVPDTRPIQVKVQSDAATEGEGTRFHGWGGTLQIGNGPIFSTRGYFTKAEYKMHINALELLGCWYTVRSLLGLLVPKHLWHRVHLSCELDSMVAIKHAKVAVSRSLNLSKLGALFYDWKEENQLQMSYRHLAGVLNERADQLSREAWSAIEWMLNPGLFRGIQDVWDAEVYIDLFASRHNRQTTKYFTWEHDWEAMGVDSLSHPWSWTRTVHAHPPPSFTSRVLQKVGMESVSDFILIAPVWPNQLWWPMLMDSITEMPLLLPNERWITTDPGLKSTWRAPYHLAAFRLSGNSQAVKAFQRRLWRQFGGQESTGTLRATMLTLCGSKHATGRSLQVLADSVRGVFMQGH